MILLCSLVVAAAAVAARAHSSSSGPDLHALDNVNFISVCRFSHRKPDDPIVFFRHPNLSHDHTFFGAVTTDAFSTAKSLRASATTCDRSADTAAYWAPTLLVDNQPVAAIEAWAWYRRGTVLPVRAFPPGLEMIGGNSHATSAQAQRVVFWNCSLDDSSPSTTVPTCPNAGLDSLRLHVHYPNCWDGKHLDSFDHHRHMAYSSAGRCPASHPVALPALELVVQYPVAGGPSVGLASFGQLTGHADFVNAWRQSSLQRLVAYCLNALRTCGHAQ